MKNPLELLEDLRDECAEMLRKGVNYNQSVGKGDHPGVESMRAAIASNSLPDMIDVLREYVTNSESRQSNGVIRDQHVESEYEEAKSLIERYLRATKTMKIAKPKSKKISREIIATATTIETPSTETVTALADVAQAVVQAASPTTLADIDVQSIEPNPYQPRRHFSQEELEDLANSIREHGVIQPIIVREVITYEGVARYQLIAGERRWRASILAGAKTIPAIVRVLDEATMLEFAIIENEQRVNVNAMDSARSYARLVELGRKQSEIGARIGKSQPLVANALRLLELPRDVQEMIESGALSRSHGTTLCRYAKYPKFVSFYAVFIVESKLPSKKIEECIQLDWDALESARKKNLLAICWEDWTRDECSAASQNHPDAFFESTYSRLVCLDVALFIRLQTEEKERKVAEAAARAATIKESVTSGEGDIPMLSSLNYNEYSDLEKPYNQCALCTKECPCRGQALNGASHKVEICLDPARLVALKAQEARDKKKIVRVAVAEKSNRVIIETANIDDRLAVIAVCRTLSVIGAKTVAAVASSLKLDFQAATFFKHETKTPQRMKMLHELGRDNLLRLTALSVLQCDLAREVDGYADKYADWYLEVAPEAKL